MLNISLRNKLTVEHFVARLEQVNLVSKTDFDNKLILALIEQLQQNI